MGRMQVGGGNIMTVLYGVLMFGGGKFFTPAIIDRFGPRGFTSIALCAQTLGLAIWGMGTYLLTYPARKPGPFDGE